MRSHNRNPGSLSIVVTLSSSSSFVISRRLFLAIVRLCISAICNRQHITIFSPRGVCRVCVHSTRANYAYSHSVFIVPSLGYDEHVLRSNNSSQTINRERAKRVPKTYHNACGTQYVVYTYPKYAYLYA